MTAHSPQREFALQVVRQLREAGYEALWAGGCVRDELLGRAPGDYDIATSARPKQVRELFGHKRTLAIGASFGVIAVLGGKGREPIEVATFRSDGAYIDGRHPSEVTYTTAEEDAQRRDFTINGLFYDPIEEKLIDYVGGEQDLQAQIIRAIGEPQSRFAEDKLRMLRAVRFATTFNFTIDEQTQSAICQMAHEIEIVSAERIGVELRKILLHVNRSRGISLLREVNLLSHVIIQLAPDKEADNQQDFQEMLTVLDRLHSPSLPLALAALLHNATDENIGSGVARALRYTNKEGQRTDWLLENVVHVADAHEQPWPGIQRLLIHPGAEELVAFHEAIVGAEDAGSKFCRDKLALPAEVLDPPPLLTGDDLVARGLKPGKHFAALLKSVRDAQLEEKIGNQTEASAFVDQWLADHHHE